MRIFYKDAVDIEEFTDRVKRIDSASLPMSYVVGDYIYCLADFPFNHIYLSMGSVVNSEDAKMKVEYYSSNGWVEVVHLNDLTNTLSKSGHIEFTPNRDDSWKLSSTNGSGEKIDELDSIYVYDIYAVRISFDSDLSADVEINYIGHNFSDDIDLYSLYPIFDDSDFLNAFKSGKVSWEEQHIKAASEIIKKLKTMGIICDAGQILDRYLFNTASVHKTAEIIFSSFGNDYVQQKKDAATASLNALDMRYFKTDKNNNAIPERVENVMSSGWLSR